MARTTANATEATSKSSDAAVILLVRLVSAKESQQPGGDANVGVDIVFVVVVVAVAIAVVAVVLVVVLVAVGLSVVILVVDFVILGSPCGSCAGSDSGSLSSSSSTGSDSLVVVVAAATSVVVVAIVADPRIKELIGVASSSWKPSWLRWKWLAFFGHQHRRIQDLVCLL